MLSDVQLLWTEHERARTAALTLPIYGSAKSNVRSHLPGCAKLCLRYVGLPWPVLDSQLWQLVGKTHEGYSSPEMRIAIPSPGPKTSMDDQRVVGTLLTVTEQAMLAACRQPSSAVRASHWKRPSC